MAKYWSGVHLPGLAENCAILRNTGEKTYVQGEVVGYDGDAVVFKVKGMNGYHARYRHQYQTLDREAVEAKIAETQLMFDVIKHLMPIDHVGQRGKICNLLYDSGWRKGAVK